MVINSIQYGTKQSIATLWALLTMPVQLLTKNGSPSLTARSPVIATEIMTVLNSSSSRWQRLDDRIIIPCEEALACS